MDGSDGGLNRLGKGLIGLGLVSLGEFLDGVKVGFYLGRVVEIPKAEFGYFGNKKGEELGVVGVGGVYSYVPITVDSRIARDVRVITPHEY